MLAWLVSFGNVVLVNVVLSGDNSLVISLAASRLPKQLQKKAIVWGSVLAIVLLMALISAASYLIRIPTIKIIAAVLLLWISIRLLTEYIHHKGLSSDQKQAASAHPHQPITLKQAIRVIALADLVMSLDNAVAMLGASGGNLSILISGLLVTIPLLIWGSHLFSIVLLKYNWIVYLAFGLIAWLSGRMFSDDPIIKWTAREEWISWAAPMVCLLILIGVGLWTSYKKVLNNAL